jgi:DNA-binding response OmpR family regulator
MSQTIFIIDDDQGIAEVVTIILSDEGYKVSTFSSEEDLEGQLDAHPPDLILLDIWLGGKDGRNILKMIRSLPKLKTIPVIMISAKHDAKQVAEEAGADGFLAKPFDINELLEMIKKLLGTSPSTSI